MKNNKLVMCGLGLACLANSAWAMQKTEKPNVILIYADDLGKGMLSFYGQKYIKTPNIDKIFKRGVSFSNAYGAHFSAPARASLMTGYSDCRDDFWTNTRGGCLMLKDTCDIAPVEAEIDAKRIKLPDNDPYLGEVFQQAGYTTGQIGKLGFSFASTRKEIDSHGWDYYYGYMDHQSCHGFFPPYLYENGEIRIIEGNTHTDCAKTHLPYDSEKNIKERWDMTGKAHYSQDLFDEKVLEFLEENKSRPFFLYHPSQLPHGPVSVNAIHKDVENNKDLNQIEKEYASMVLMLDETVGMILDKVEELGIADNTIIIFSADNGHEVYTEIEGRTSSKTHYLTNEPIDNCTLRFTSEVVGDTFNGNMGLSGKKRSNLQGGICVPLVYYSPKLLKKGESDEVVANYDFIATMADLIGVDIESDKDASSYLEVVKNPRIKRSEDRYVLVDSYEGPTVVRNDGWKLRYCNVTDNVELYDLKKDPKELNDLAATEVLICQELTEIMKSEVEKTMTRGGFKMK